MAYSGAQVTRLGLGGFPRGLYGSFAGKTEVPTTGPHNPGKITRLGLSGTPRGLYGVFAGKAAAGEVEESQSTAIGGYDHRQYDFGEHYIGLRQEDKDRIDRIIEALTPKAKAQLETGRPPKAFRKKVARVLPEYAAYKPKPSSEYLAEAEKRRQARAAVNDRTKAIINEQIQQDEELLVLLMMSA